MKQPITEDTLSKAAEGALTVPPTNRSSEGGVRKEKFLRLSAVRERVPYSRATIYRLIAEGKFPRSYPLGAGAVAFLEREIDEWIEARIASAQAAEAR